MQIEKAQANQENILIILTADGTNAHNTTKYILFAARFFFGCVVSICSVCVVKLTKGFFLFAGVFFYLQRIYLFGCVVSICSVCVVKLRKLFP